jgi:hypothetical protein
MNPQFQTHLTLSWGISRGKDTFGYNIRRLRDDATGKRYRCMGGGYDMTGTVFADWLTDVYQDRLRAIREQAYYHYALKPLEGYAQLIPNDNGLYGMYAYDDGSVSVDGACGLNSVISIAKAIGLDVSCTYARGQGETEIVVTEVE